MLPKYYIPAIVLLQVSVSSTFATSTIPRDIPLNLQERDYSTTAPQPFGEVHVKIQSTPDGLTELLRIKTDLGEPKIDVTLYSALKNLSEPEITYSDPKMSKSGTVEYVGIYFHVGDAYSFDLGNDVPGCAPPCPQVDRDIVSFKVYRNLSVTREYLKLEDVFERR